MLPFRAPVFKLVYIYIYIYIHAHVNYQIFVFHVHVSIEAVITTILPEKHVYL